jgi:hypothetical protein
VVGLGQGGVKEGPPRRGRGGGIPAWLGDGGRAEELQDAERKLARGLVGGEEERTRGLRVEVGSAASNGRRRRC